MNERYVVRREAFVPEWESVRIDPRVYTSSDWLTQEFAHLFRATWLVAGRAEQVAKPGDFFTFEVGSESILVVNAGDPAHPNVRAYYNVCRHRGRRIVDQSEGHEAKQFTCPYHLWTYGLDGGLRGVPDHTSFPEFERSVHGLAPVHCAVWQGLVFVNLDDEPEPLEEYIGVLAQCLKGAIDPGVLVKTEHHEFAANWKTVLEAFIETYHIAGLHPQVARELDWKEAAIQHFRRHNMTVVPAAKAREWPRRRTEDWQSWIADPRYLEFHYTLFPNISIHVFIQGLTFLFRCLPHPTDPERMHMDLWVWARVRPGKPTPEAGFLQDAHIEILEQDYANFASVQHGMRSRSFQGPALNFFESRIAHLHAVLQQYGQPSTLGAGEPMGPR